MEGADDTEILIVGGGIAGMALAGFLQQEGYSTTVAEQASEWKRVGWGIGLWGNGLAVLDKLGVAEEAVAAGSTPDRFAIQGRTGAELASVELPGEQTFIVIHRADLHEALRGAVPDDTVRMGTSPAAIHSSGDRVTVTFDDRSSDEFDAVIGADGVHSQVRELLFEDWTVEDRSTVTWSFWAPDSANRVAEDTMASRWLPGTEVFLGSVGGQDLVNIATRMPPGETPDRPALGRLGQVADRIGDDFAAIVDTLDPDSVFFDRNREVKASSWTRGRTGLIGDAAHALHPISGMGAALALEDAYVLADELSRRTVPEALEQYEARRRGRVSSVRRMAHIEERITFTQSSVAAWLRDGLVRRTPVAQWFLEREAGRLASFSTDEL